MIVGVVDEGLRVIAGMLQEHSAPLDHLERKIGGELQRDERGNLIPSPGFCTQQEVGKHVDSYQQGLNDALRKAPHVILLGEIRDAETMQVAIQAALTAQEEAAGAVLAAAELAAEEAAVRAQAANDSAAAAEAASADLSQGIESLNDAISAMLSARDERESADAERAAADALREVAAARAAEAVAAPDCR